MPDSVRYDLQAAVATVTMDRADALNALDNDLKVGLRDALAAAAGDVDVRAVVLTGNGRAFCVGQDLAEHARNLATLGPESPEAVWATVSEHYAPITTALATMPKPVIAAVNGVAAGAGAAFAFACDFRVVAHTAGFNMAFANIGLAADSGVSWTLPRLVGIAKAKQLLLLPGTIGAAEALDLGLATEVADSGAVLSRALELARQLAQGPTVAYGAIRRSLAFSAAHPLDESLEFERDMMILAGGTADHHRAVRDFVDKKSPTFEGR